TEVSAGTSKRPLRSFPAALPMFRLDRIYSRGLQVEANVVHHGLPWSKISDHAAVSARFSFALVDPAG
ncbi:MAG: hypothetical protein Q8J75_01855, partial [Rhodocyclaceae bacterium]|nr:hypothetical protein [Rhodocyclaceae bacterium]